MEQSIRDQRFLEKLENVLEKVYAILEKPESLRDGVVVACEVEGKNGGRVIKNDLKIIVTHLLNIKYAIKREHIPERNKRYAVLTHMILDSWPTGSELGNLITELEAYYKML